MVGLLPIDRLNDVRRDIMINSFIIAAVGLFIGIWVVIMLTKKAHPPVECFNKFNRCGCHR